MISEFLVERFLFFPLKVLEFYPSQFDLSFEEIRFKNREGLDLHGWFFPGHHPQKTLLFLHGNAGNIGNRLEKIKLLSRIGWNIFIFDYRGFGGSGGKPTIPGIVEDSHAALSFLRETKGLTNKQIVLWGESLGGAMAVELGAEEPFAAVILESTFTSLREVANTHYPFLPNAVVPDELRSIEKIRGLKAPLLSLHGDRDETVPFEMGQKLYEAAPHPKRFFRIPGGHHNDLYAVAPQKYLETVEEFISQV